MWGLTVEEATKPPVEVWPDHLKVAAVFDRMQSNWRHTFGGVQGLIYEAIPMVMKALKIDEDEWPEIFEDLRVMEIAALKRMRELREQERKK